jgi:Spy/CpxP family protein refolding chaperone
MKFRRTLGAGLCAWLAVCGLGVGAAAARPDHHRGPGAGLDQLERRVEGLGLDAETSQAVYAVLDAARQEGRGLRTQLHQQHEALRALLEQDTPDEAAVLAQVDKLGALQTEERKQEMRAFLKVRSLLTPEQRQALRPPEGRGGPRGRGH